jgi:hypothetical protein
MGRCSKGAPTNAKAASKYRLAAPTNAKAASKYRLAAPTNAKAAPANAKAGADERQGGIDVP